MVCGICGGPLRQKSRPLLILVGLAMLATYFLTRLSAALWPVAIIGMLTGAYLLAWATIGRAQWCRHCKMMAVIRRSR